MLLNFFYIISHQEVKQEVYKEISKRNKLFLFIQNFHFRNVLVGPKYELIAGPFYLTREKASMPPDFSIFDGNKPKACLKRWIPYWVPTR